MNKHSFSIDYLICIVGLIVKYGVYLTHHRNMQTETQNHTTVTGFLYFCIWNAICSPFPGWLAVVGVRIPGNVLPCADRPFVMQYRGLFKINFKFRKLVQYRILFKVYLYFEKLIMPHNDVFLSWGVVKCLFMPCWINGRKEGRKCFI